jgi:predicted flap endonuclease-1-like 5' DNA nuclease
MNRLTKVGGAVVGVGAGVAAVLWLMRDRLSGPPVEPVTVDDAPAFRVPPSPKNRSKAPSVDDLSEVTGIGPVYRARLEEAGIGSFAALAAADPESVAEAAEVAVDRAQDWIEQAAGLAG